MPNPRFTSLCGPHVAKALRHIDTLCKVCWHRRRRSDVPHRTLRRSVCIAPGSNGQTVLLDGCRDPGYPFASPYKLPNGQETSKWLLLQVGTSPRTMPIALISNTSISESEWRHWKDQCNADNKPQLNTHDYDSALERIKKAST